MGCLSISVQNLTIKSLVVDVGTNNQVSANATGYNEPLYVQIKDNNTPVTITAAIYNSKPRINCAPRNKKLTITAGLVCGVGLDLWEFFDVTQGHLVVENGHLKVYKE